VGTSGWHYPHWRGVFYPPKLPPKRFLEEYARSLSSVEINNSFYRLPEPQTLLRWRETVPPGFLFALKASRFITHVRKLDRPRESLDLLYERIASLGEKRGPVLFQTPPSLGFDPTRLSAFLEALPAGAGAVFEFRHPGWFNEETYRMLSARGAAFCIFELAGRKSPEVVTGAVAYVRLHGPGGAYRGRYDDRTLSAWARRFAAWAAAGKEVYCYFDNTDDPEGFAAGNAMTLDRMAKEAAGGVGGGPGEGTPGPLFRDERRSA
jgi:uncharacterized protein YecE (DUF72 family)